MILQTHVRCESSNLFLTIFPPYVFRVEAESEESHEAGDAHDGGGQVEAAQTLTETTQPSLGLEVGTGTEMYHEIG